MKKFIQAIFDSRLRKDQEGQDLIEYALIAGWIAVCAAALVPTGVGKPVAAVFERLVEIFKQA